MTGHRGYIGALLTPALIKAGYDVVGMDCGFYETTHFHGALAEVVEIPKDIRLARLDDFEGVDSVIHLAALSNDPTGDLDSAATDSINRAATESLGRLAKEAGVKRFLFLSSCSLYGAVGDEMIDETATAAPLTPYGHSKIESEKALFALNDRDFAVTCLRGGTAYGGSPRLRLDLLINDLVSTAACYNRIELLSDGEAWRPLVHIGDFVDAAIAILGAPFERVAGEAFNIGRTDQNFRVIEAARLVNKLLPAAELTVAEGAGHDKRTYRVSCDKAHERIPGLAHGWVLEEGVRDLAALCRQRLLTQGPWQRQDFSRVSTLKKLMLQQQLDLTDPEHVTWYARGCLRSA